MTDDLGIPWREGGDEDDPFNPRERMPDDIDFPHIRDESDRDFNDDDIPF